MVHPDRSTPRQLLSTLDDLAEIVEDNLDPDAESFVATFEQVGGNGGSQYDALLDTWMKVLGPSRAVDLFQISAAYADRLLQPAMREGMASAPQLRSLIAHRFGDIAAKYWTDAVGEMPDFMSSLEAVLLDSTDRSDPSHPTSSSPRAATAYEDRRAIAELHLRTSEQARHYPEAKIALRELASQDSPPVADLLDEYKHLQSARDTDLNEDSSDTVQLLDLLRRLKLLLAPRREPGVRRKERLHSTSLLDTEDIESETEPRISKPIQREDYADQRPHEIGATLESGFVELLRSIFNIDADIASSLTIELRRQKSGYQFGHDISFEANALGDPHLRCHIECKNLQNPLKLKDIADKLFQQSFAPSGTGLHNWILISPHVDPNNELQEAIRALNDQRMLPFDIQIWSPQNGIKSLFAMNSEVYRAIYGTERLPEIDRDAVRAEFLRRVRPRRRLPRSVEQYLRNPWQLCFPSEDSAHFEALLHEPAELSTIDVAGRPIGSLRRVVDQWLDDPVSPSTMLLLGEFGDGKSFFSYSLCRRLSDDFLMAPQGSFLPIRLSLRELRRSGSADRLLDRWLGDQGIDRADWRRLSAEHRLLIVLDGFDEMSVDLDSIAIDHNLGLLAEMISVVLGTQTQPNTRSRIIVTSRGRFFDRPREEQALRDRLGSPIIVRIRPLTRTEVLQHLTRFARTHDLETRLAQLRVLYDPIGLAAKPLFLQMVKDTLEDLPTSNFGASTLYETYIVKSLRRKAELLRSGTPFELTAELIDRLRTILEAVAVALHKTEGANSVDLRVVEGDHGDLASLLWQMTSTPARQYDQQFRAQDARTRVSIRSLLCQVPSDDDSAWSVNFFHRSMYEYFLACAITRAVDGLSSVSIAAILGDRPLSAETVQFVTDRLRKPEERSRAVDRLDELIASSAEAHVGRDALGGNALTLYYALTGKLPHRPLVDMSLNHVRLGGADLRGVDLSHSSLREANLDNADLRGANLTECDLTGLRVEVTTLVTTLAIDNARPRVVAGYSDGTIREWSPNSSDTWISEVLFEWPAGTTAESPSSPIRHLAIISDDLLLAISGLEAVVLARAESGWATASRFAVSPFLREVGRSHNGGLVALHAGTPKPVVAIDLSEREPGLSESGVGGSGALSIMNHLRPARFSDDESLISRDWIMTRSPGRWTLHRANGDNTWHVEMDSFPTAFSVDEDGDGLVLTVGTADGAVQSCSVIGTTINPILVATDDRHDGPVTVIARSSSGLIASGGPDRCIRVWTTRDERATVSTLILTLRCSGALLDGVKGPSERQLLEKLSRL